MTIDQIISEELANIEIAEDGGSPLAIGMDGSQTVVLPTGAPSAAIAAELRG